jgi:competence protein ComEC
MYAIVPRYPELGIGETLSLSGHLTPPPTFDDFDYAAYLARQGVFSYMTFPKVVPIGHNAENGWQSFITARRVAARATLQSAVDEPEASIAVGVVTGDRSSMSDFLQAAFRNSGTTHILAISGQNISLLVGVAMIGSPLFAPWISWIAIIPAIGIFIGIFEEAGVKAAGVVTAISYIIWSLWLVAAGINLLWR